MPKLSLAEARAAASIFDPQRLRVARHIRRLSRAAVADQIEVSAAAVGQWEAGESRPRAQSLLALAGVLDFPVGYFATSGRQLQNLDASCSFFRSLRKSKQVDRDAAMAHAVLIAEVATAIERHALLPAMTIPQLQLDLDASSEHIDEIAREVREHWSLDDDPIDDVLRELERHGAVAARLALAEDVDAFSWPGAARPVVILGADKGDRARSRFDAAHELGHLVMHRDHPKPGDRQLERQAHRFASAFLLPPPRLEADWPAGRLNWRDLMALKRKWQISLGALLYRAREDHLISETAYESAVKYMSRSGWRRQEPGDLGSPEQPRLLRSAIQALERHGIDAAVLSEQAQIPLELINLYVSPPESSTRVAVEL
jgi:Zn-dependent peptidase ImmA (M78 family)/DNA-binding transcriptional regulator YiaG